MQNTSCFTLLQNVEMQILCISVLRSLETQTKHFPYKRVRYSEATAYLVVMWAMVLSFNSYDLKSIQTCIDEIKNKNK